MSRLSWSTCSHTRGVSCRKNICGKRRVWVGEGLPYSSGRVFLGKRASWRLRPTESRVSGAGRPLVKLSETAKPNFTETVISVLEAS
eukprot:1329368-Amorphochlora_amoeboformis.AAC.1